jgi:hypothetical protein
MTDRPSLLILASAATLALALAQPVAADEVAMPAAAPAAPAPAAEAPAAEAPAAAAPEAAPATEAPAPTAAPEAAAAAPTPANDSAKQRMEEHRAKMSAERNRRYAELRQRASEVGIELPETPPWDQVEMPKMPEMPDDMEAALAAHYQAMREHAEELGIDLPETPPAKLMTAAERRAKMEQMRNMTPEQRMAARAENYKQLRERAAAQGIDLPETPPWEQAMQRRKAMQEKWEAYRKEVDAMTDEQREAAKAVFGASPMADAPQMPMQPQMPPMDMPMQRQMPPMEMPMRRQMPPMDMPMRGQGPCPQGDCGGMAPPSGMMPGWNGNQGGGQMPPQPQGGYGAPWGRGY